MGAQIVVRGCTKLPFVRDATAAEWPVPAIYPTTVVARQLVRRARDKLAAVAAAPIPGRRQWRTS